MRRLTDLLDQYRAAHSIGDYDDQYEQIKDAFEAELTRCQERTDEPGSLIDLIRQYGDARANEVAAGEYGSYLDGQTCAVNAEMLIHQIRDVAALAVKTAADRADLLHDALADAARNIPGVTAALHRAEAVLRADHAGQLSPRHTDTMGRPMFCDDAQTEIERFRGNAELLSASTMGEAFDRIDAIIAERDQAQAELGGLNVEWSVDDPDEGRIIRPEWTSREKAEDWAAVGDPPPPVQYRLVGPWRDAAEGVR